MFDWSKVHASTDQPYIYRREPEQLMGVIDELRERKPDLILDLACGEGRNALWLKQKGYRVIGLDIDFGALERVREQERTMRLIRGDLNKLPFPQESFDAVVFIDLFHHLDDFRTPLAEIFRVLKSKAWLLINAFTTDEPRVGEEISKDVWREQGIIFRYFSQDQFAGILENQGFRVRRIEPYERLDPPHPTFRCRKTKHRHWYWFAVAQK